MCVKELKKKKIKTNVETTIKVTIYKTPLFHITFKNSFINPGIQLLFYNKAAFSNLRAGGGAIGLSNREKNISKQMLI